MRNLEDSIRATKKYSEGVHIMATNHPIQGADFPSKKFCKYYEFYPDAEINSFWDVPVFGNYRVIGITFIYDYRINRAEVQMTRKADMDELQKAIPSFGQNIVDVIASRNTVQATQEVKR